MNLFGLSLFRHLEAFLIYITTANKKDAAILFTALVIPGPIKFFFIFILAMRLLPATISGRDIKLLLSLPFSRSEIFIYSFLFGFSLIFFATTIDRALFGRSGSPDFLNCFIFYAFYFGIMTVNALKIGKIMIIPMLILAFDLLSSFIAPGVYDFVSQYSPLYQQNQPLSLLAALAVLVISFLLFVFGRRERW